MIVVKEYVGDGSNAVNLQVGFKARRVTVRNITDSDKIAVCTLRGDGTTYSMLINDSGSGTTDLSEISSNKPEITDRGFNTGTNANLIESGKTFLVEFER